MFSGPEKDWKTTDWAVIALPGQQNSGFIARYIVGRKRYLQLLQVSTSAFDNQNDTTVSRPARKIVCHLSRFTDTNEQAKCCCIKRSDITFRVTNKLNAIDLVVSGWRGAEFFQLKLQWTVQEVGSWAASELHTSTAVHPSPKPETTKAFAPHVRKS